MHCTIIFYLVKLIFYSNVYTLFTMLLLFWNKHGFHLICTSNKSVCCALCDIRNCAGLCWISNRFTMSVDKDNQSNKCTSGNFSVQTRQLLHQGRELLS